MKRHLLLVASPQQLEFTNDSLKRLKATPLEQSNIANSYHLKNKKWGQLEFILHILPNSDAVTAHLRLHPVDLLIYDERGGVDAHTAMDSIKNDIDALAKLWGPDFLFPTKRAVAILDETDDATHRAFLLGQDHVRDVLVNPQHLGTILRWLAHLFAQDLHLTENKIGLTLSGGGLEGFLYQLGVMYALDKSIEGFTVNDFHVYSGVSSGSLVAGLLAKQSPIEELIKSVYGESDILPPLKSSTVFDPATGSILKRISEQSLTWGGLDLQKWMQKALRSVPTGFFKGDKLKNFFKEVIEEYGKDDSFQSLGNELYIGVTDEDSFEHIIFGEEPWKDIPLSEAVRASSAIPPFFTPHQIRGRWYVDGQITRTCNLEHTVKKGCNLIFIVDPLKPYASSEAGSVDKEGGVYTLIQTIKAMVHTRFKSVLSHLTNRYPHVDFMVFQPDEECALLMSGSPMRFNIRKQIIELAYKGTLRKLRDRHNVYHAKLNKFDLNLAPKETLQELEGNGIEF